MGECHVPCTKVIELPQCTQAAVNGMTSLHTNYEAILLDRNAEAMSLEVVANWNVPGYFLTSSLMTSIWSMKVLVASKPWVEQPINADQNLV